MRAAALHTLETIAEKGDAGVIRAVSARLEHADTHVRVAAMEALEEIEKGDAGAIHAVPARLWSTPEAYASGPLRPLLTGTGGTTRLKHSRRSTK